jgi:membrane complex biogenesis BtpA family protein
MVVMALQTAILVAETECPHNAVDRNDRAADNFAMDRDLFGKRCAVVGMVHLRALPGTPHYRAGVDEIVVHACREAEILAACGVDAVLIENMHDRPYLRAAVGPEIVSVMTAAACAIRGSVSIPCGVQVLAAANEEALAVALAAGLDFIRAEGFVFAHVADEGVIEGCAAKLLRARKAWGAESVKIFADIKKKHSSHAITADVDIAETAHAAEFFSADGVIVTGAATGQPVNFDELAAVANATELPVLVGSGASVENLDAIFPHANAVIVGSSIKQGGRWDAPIDPERVRAFTQRAVQLR